MKPNRGVITAAQVSTAKPTRVLIDTSVVVEAMTNDRASHSEASELLTAIEDAGAEVVFSRLLELEALQSAAYVAGSRVGDRRAGLRDGRVRRSSRRIADDVRAAWHEYLRRNRWQRVELHTIADDIHDVMFSTGLSSYDAVHAVSAIAAGCDAIATLDSDFGRLPPGQVATIITTPHRLDRTRRLRATV